MLMGALPAAGLFVVVALNGQAALHHREHHFAAKVVQRIGRRTRKYPCLYGTL